MGTSNWLRRSGSVEASSRLRAVSSAATMNPSASTPMCSFRRSRRLFEALCSFQSPQPRISSPWNRRSSRSRRAGSGPGRHRNDLVPARECGAVRSLEGARPIKRSSESRDPSVWWNGRPTTTRSVNAVRIARSSAAAASAQTVLPWYPRCNYILVQSDRDIAAAPEATLVLPSVPDSVLCLSRAVDSARLPCGHDVASSIP